MFANLRIDIRLYCDFLPESSSSISWYLASITLLYFLLVDSFRFALFELLWDNFITAIIIPVNPAMTTPNIINLKKAVIDNRVSKP